MLRAENLTKLWVGNSKREPNLWKQCGEQSEERQKTTNSNSERTELVQCGHELKESEKER